ncbi:hypothetical protein DA792_19445 [Celeribacter baekdonensis]|uniref:Uncharacterized protein n=2 Tax=Celeribacter baekdonensis TaxID=875171 RepID=A0A2R4M717_9RHOB|nr:hypothetical protein DA792_19445 [Celeribacter baekdonensis]
MRDEAVEALTTYNIWQLYGPDGKYSSLVEVRSDVLNRIEISILAEPNVENWQDLGTQVTGISLLLDGDDVGKFDFAVTKDCGYYLAGEYEVVKLLSDI